MPGVTVGLPPTAIRCALPAVDDVGVPGLRPLRVISPSYTVENGPRIEEGIANKS